MMKWTELLLLPLHLFVCCLLHLIFASYRFSIVIAHLSPFLPFFSAATIPSSSLSQPEQQDDVNFDRSRWLKTPKHVGIIFVPSSNPSSFFSPSSWFYRRGVTQHEGRELQVLAKLIKDVRALLEWCEKLGVESVSFYDEEGKLLCGCSCSHQVMTKTVIFRYPRTEFRAGQRGDHDFNDEAVPLLYFRSNLV